MASESKTHIERADARTLVIRRTFRAPAALVYDALTKPELLKRWWAPRSLGVELLECTVDARVGGRYRHVFGHAGAPPMAFTGEFREVVPGVRTVCTEIFEPAAAAGAAIVTTALEPTADGTRMTVTSQYPSGEVLEAVLATGMETGMRESYDQLDALVGRGSTEVERASDRELVIRRSFRAPPELVYDAFTKPELLRRWWAPRSLGVELFECASDARVGGRYRFVFGRQGEPPMAFSGEYRELVRDAAASKVVYSQIFEPMPDTGEGVITMTFERAANGHTRMTSRELYPSKEVLDGAIASGMERGMRETLEQLEDLLAT